MPTEETYESGRMAERGDQMTMIASQLAETPPIETDHRMVDDVAESMEQQRQDRLDAIAEAHAAGDNYFDGYTTIDGEEVEVWLTPDGSTVYYDRDGDEVVDVEWDSNADRNAAMDAAHDAGDAFYDGTTELNGEEVQVWIAPDGMEVYVDPDSGDVVAIKWPDGQAPEYQGQVLYDGENVAVYEYPNGTYGLVSDGETVLLFDDWDDVELDATSHPVHGDVYTVPKGPPTYDSAVYDADTGTPIMVDGTGDVLLDGALTHYQPPGEDYVVVIDQFGNVIGTFELPPDEDWSILGITKYEDGSVTIDLGGATVTVDLDADGGIWFESDGLGELIEGADWVGSVEAGVEWDEDGVEVDVAASVAGVGDMGYTIEVGKDGFDISGYADIGVDIGGMDVGVRVEGEIGYSDGKVYAGGDVGVDMNVGLLDIDANMGGYVEYGSGGFEAEGYWDGKVGALGFFVEGGQAGSIALGDDGLTVTYSEYRGVGHELIGSVRGGGEVQFETDGTRGGTEVTGHVYGSTNDRDGDEIGVAGRYLSVDGDGDVSGGATNALLDTGVTREDYDRHAGTEDENLPDVPDGSADFDMDRPDQSPGEVPADDADGVAGRPGRIEFDGDRRLDPDAGMRPGMGREDAPDRQTMPAGPDQSSGRIERPEETSAGGRTGVPEASTGDGLGNFEIQDVVAGTPRDDGANEMPNPARVAGGRDRPDTSDAQFADSPPAGDEVPPLERPEIFERRDSDAKSPEDEEPADPTPTGERPKLFERDGQPTPKDDGPDVDGPTIKPDLFTERFQDTDADGDGVPDGRFDPNDPIGTDSDTLADVVAGGPPVGSTVAAGPDQSSGTIDHPGDAGFMSAEGGMDPTVTRPREFIGETEKNLRPERVADSDDGARQRPAVAESIDDDIMSMPVVMSGGSTMATDDIGVRKDSGEAHVDGVFTMDAGSSEVRKDSGEAHVDGVFTMDAGSSEVRKDSGEAHVDGVFTMDAGSSEVRKDSGEAHVSSSADVDAAADLDDDITAVPAGPTDGDVTRQQDRFVGNDNAPVEASAIVQAVEPAEASAVAHATEPATTPGPAPVAEPTPIVETDVVAEAVATAEPAPVPVEEPMPEPDPVADDGLDDQL